jgi:hypothetical protein
MKRLLIVDDSLLATDLLAEDLRHHLRWEVVTVERPDDLPSVLDLEAPFDLAVIDLSFRDTELNGLDALLAVHRRLPACRLVVYSQVDPPFVRMLRDAWEAFDLATVLSKSMPIAGVRRALVEAETHGSAPVDPVLRPTLPAKRSPWRSLDGFGRLVTHAGHAKLWQALIDLDDEPTYEQLARRTGLKLKSVRNYRSELLHDLALYDMERPKMRQMQQFAKCCRPLLEPHIRHRLAPDGGGQA